jgi:type I restriction enzyme S subunit
MTRGLAKTWDCVPLRDICEQVNYGYTASAKQEPIGPKFLRITDIVDELINWHSVPYCKISEKEFAKYELQQGDIVIARTGATSGYAKMIKKHPKAVFASYLVRLRIKKEHDWRYAGLIVESDDFKRYIKSVIGGAAQPQANAQVLTSFPIPLPPLPTQRKIATILSAYDDLIENNTRRIRILEEMAQMIYREWFVNFRFPGHEKAKMIESQLGMIPQGWEVHKLNDICTIVMGQSPSSEFYNQVGDGLPFHQGVTDFGQHFPVDRVFSTATNRIAQRGDILFSVRAPVGRINTAAKRIVIGRGLCAIRSNHGYQSFVLYQLKEKFKEEDSMGGGTIFKAVTKEDMQGIKMLVPSGSTPLVFEEIVQPILRQIEILTLQIANLRRTRDLLLPKLISGELDVENVDIAVGRLADA